MTCEVATTLLHLNRPGERTEEEEHELAAHLRSCRVCAEEARLIRSTRKSMNLFPSAPVPTIHVADEIHNIMRTIRRNAGSAPGIFDLIHRLASRPGLRIAYGLFSVAVMTVMALQLIPEGTTDAHSHPRTGPYVAFSIDTRQLDQLSTLPLPETVKARVLTDPQFEIRKTDIGRSSGIGTQTMLRYLSLTEEQRSFAALAIASIQKTSALSIRLGKTGG